MSRLKRFLNYGSVSPTSIVLLPILFASGAAQGDVLTLANGDRVTGTVETLNDGKLEFETTWAGTIEVSWASITNLQCQEKFEVETATGRVYFGTLTKSKDSLRILTDEGVLDIDPVVVTEMKPEAQADPGLWRRLEGRVEFGHSFARGNSNTTQSSFSADAHYRRPKYGLQGKIVSIFSEQDGAEGANRHALDARYDRFLSEKTFVFSLGGLERDEQQRLNLRSKVGGGFGRELINTQETRLSLLGGVDYANERFRAEQRTIARTVNSAEGLVGFDFTRVGSAGLEFTAKFMLHPNLTEVGRYRIEFDSGVHVSLVRGFTWGISLYDRFDSNPPVSIERNDYGLLSTLGYEF